MPGTLRLHIDQFNENAKTWADSSGNGYHATSTNAPSLTTQNGLAVAEFVKSQSDEMTTLPLPPPSGSMTMLFVGYLPPTTANQYGGVMVMRDGAEGLGGGLYITETGGLSYLWGGIYDVIKLSRSNEIALYAVTITPTEAKLYRVDSTGTTVMTNSAAHPALSYSQNRPLYLNNNTIGNYRADFKARFFEYYQNQVLTQTDLEGIYQFLVSDDIRPSDVTGLEVDTNRNITSNPATDNFAVTGYLTERRIGGGAWLQLTPTSRNFQDNENLPTQPGVYAFEYRRKAYDAKNNQSLNWSNIASASFVITAPPIIIDESPLAYAQIGKRFQYQFRVRRGSGSGYFDLQVQGNLPNNAVNNQGFLDILTVGNTDYNFILRWNDSDGRIFSKAFSIPVSEYAYIQLEYKRPLKRNPIVTATEFPIIEGLPDIAEDAPLKYEYDVTLMASGQQKVKDLEKFFEDHRLRQPFLWYDADWDELRLVYAVSPFPSERMLAYGGVQVTLRDV